jgi:hypothetical protein
VHTKQAAEQQLCPPEASRGLCLSASTAGVDVPSERSSGTLQTTAAGGGGGGGTNPAGATSSPLDAPPGQAATPQALPSIGAGKSCNEPDGAGDGTVGGAGATTAPTGGHRTRHTCEENLPPIVAAGALPTLKMQVRTHTAHAPRGAAGMHACTTWHSAMHPGLPQMMLRPELVPLQTGTHVPPWKLCHRVCSSNAASLAAECSGRRVQHDWRTAAGEQRVRQARQGDAYRACILHAARVQEQEGSGTWQRCAPPQGPGRARGPQRAHRAEHAQQCACARPRRRGRQAFHRAVELDARAAAAPPRWQERVRQLAVSHRFVEGLASCSSGCAACG